MKRLHWALLVWGFFMFLSAFTENIFVDGLMVGSTIILLWEVLDLKAPWQKRDEEYKAYHAKKKTVLYGNEGDRMEYALSHNANPADIILATEPQRLVGIKHYPHVAFIANWQPSINDDERVYATTRTLDILKNLYGDSRRGK